MFRIRRISYQSVYCFIACLSCKGSYLWSTEKRSNVKSVIRLIAVQAQFFVSGQPNPVCTSCLTTAITDIGIKNSGLLRQPDFGFLDIKHLIICTAMIIVERFFPRHVARLCFQDKADRLSGFPIIERKCLFAAHMEQ